MKTKQQQLTFEKGITNVPSNTICSDNALQECVNLTYRDGEHHVIQQPKLTVTFDHDSQTVDPDITSITRDLLYVHRYNGQERYIIRQTVAYTSESDRATTTRVQWGTIDDNGTYVPKTIAPDNPTEYYFFDAPEGLITVTSIGKTLVFNTSEGLKYAIGKENSYDFYEKIPEPQFSAWMEYPPRGRGLGSRHVQSVGQATNIIDSSNDPVSIVQDKRSEFDDLVVGLYSKNLKKVADKKGFCEPFFVRVALKMYDGSYTLIGNPILLLPVVNHSTYFWMNGEDLYCDTCYALLCCSQLTDYSDFSDIIKDVVLFVSDGVPIYDTAKTDQTITKITDGKVADGIYLTSNGNVWKTDVAPSRSTDCYRMIERRGDSEISDDIMSQSVFYKLCEIGLRTVLELNTREKIHSHILENITTQEQLRYDDFYSHCSLLAENVYAYNSRINLSGIHRGFFDGFDYFLPFDNANENTYIIKVRIKTDSGDRIVKKQITTTQKQGIWFYYPDPRAQWVSIWKEVSDDQWQLVLNSEMTEHSGLNGAYYFWGMSHTFDTDPPGTVPLPEYVEGQNIDATNAIPYDTAPIVTPEYLPNQIATSEVNNPFVFLAHGYNTIGTGNIVGMAALTQALSQGQFGQYPLLVFTDEGIWAMSLDNTGLYQSVHPMSREVCSNPQSITQTDNAVFFVSEKGLMVVAGSQVQCVSPQLSGKADHDVTFSDFFADCSIAYDYRDSLLWLFNKAVVRQKALVYSIKSGTFSFVELPDDMKAVVNNYPDYLLQDVSDDVYSLMRRPDINEDTAHYTAHILTRPLKLENAFALKSIMQIQHVEDANLNSTLTFRIFASNNNEDWVELDSLRGIPWKYYQFSYDFNRLDACDTFAGTVLISQERRTNKLR